MKHIRKYRAVPYLMLLSQLLLAGFVVSWLMSQYSDEKELLRSEMTTMYVGAREKALDTLLIRQIIIPTLQGDTVSDFIQKIKGNETFAPGDSVKTSVIVSQINDSLPQKRATFTLSISDSSIVIPGFNSGQDATFQKGINELLVRSTKLFMFSSTDTISDAPTLKVVLRDLIDTSLFMQTFENQLDQDGRDLGVSWEPKPADSLSGTGKRAFAVFDKFDDNLPVALIENYRWLLFKIILPQVIFAVVLLTLTALAFYMSHTSLKRQVMMNRLRNDFVSNLTHELKTPVATVKVALESLRKFDMKKDPGKAADYLEMSALEMERLDGLIARVLNHVLLEDSAGLANREPFDFTEMIENSVQKFKPRLQEMNAIINFEMPGALVMRADELLCRGVLHNLLDNSLKYCDKNPEINISLETSGDKIILKFSDNGPGIPGEYLGRVFEKFFRVPGFNRHNVKGYGLGLSYVYLVMKAHNGMVAVKNTKPSGCMFTMEFPGQKS